MTKEQQEPNCKRHTKDRRLLSLPRSVKCEDGETEKQWASPQHSCSTLRLRSCVSLPISSSTLYKYSTILINHHT